MNSGLATMVLVIGACRPTTPYEPMTVFGGYADRSLAPGRHLVTVRVNSHTDRSVALEYLSRRSSELCPVGFEVIDSSSGDSISSFDKSTMSSIIQCTVPAVAMCFAYERDGKRKARCAPTLASCERARQRLTVAVSACVSVRAGDTMAEVPIAAPAVGP